MVRGRSQIDSDQPNPMLSPEQTTWKYPNSPLQAFQTQKTSHYNLKLPGRNLACTKRGHDVLVKLCSLLLAGFPPFPLLSSSQEMMTYQPRKAGLPARETWAHEPCLSSSLSFYFKNPPATGSSSAPEKVPPQEENLIAVFHPWETNASPTERCT